MSSSRSIARVILPACALGASALLGACSDSNGPANGVAPISRSPSRRSPLPAAGRTVGSARSDGFARPPRHRAPAARTRWSSLAPRSPCRASSSPPSIRPAAPTMIIPSTTMIDATSSRPDPCSSISPPTTPSSRCSRSSFPPAPTAHSRRRFARSRRPTLAAPHSSPRIREFANASVRVEGTFDGTPFVYSGSPNASLELSFDPPITVGSTATTVTVHVSIDRWFTDRNGNLIDPATANAGGANEKLVSDNVRRSFHAFEDDEHHGDDGHGDDGFEGDDNGNDGGNMTERRRRSRRRRPRRALVTARAMLRLPVTRWAAAAAPRTLPGPRGSRA